MANKYRPKKELRREDQSSLYKVSQAPWNKRGVVWDRYITVDFNASEEVATHAQQAVEALFAAMFDGGTFDACIGPLLAVHEALEGDEHED